MTSKRSGTPRPKIGRSTSSKARWLHEHAQAVSVITAIFALLISTASFFVSVRTQVDTAQREEGRANIYLEGTPPPNRCVDAKGTEALTGCRMAIKPSDPSIRVMRHLVQFPASEFPGGEARFTEGYGKLDLSLADRTEFLWRRSQIINDVKNGDRFVHGVLPIVISSYYQHNGKKYLRTGAYLIGFYISNSADRRYVVPNELIYCGRLDRMGDFLVDPWMTSVVGIEGKESASVAFDCLNRVTWFATQKGRFKVTSSLVRDIEREGPRPGGSIPMTFRSFDIVPVSQDVRVHQSAKPLV